VKIQGTTFVALMLLSFLAGNALMAYLVRMDAQAETCRIRR
jgi:hypothetical protein